MNDLRFKVKGQLLKVAVERRLADLQKQLDRRVRALDTLLQDTRAAQAYRRRYSPLAPDRSANAHLARVLDALSPKERSEASELCQRIAEIEEQMHHLGLIREHVDDEQLCELTRAEMDYYGFEADA